MGQVADDIVQQNIIDKMNERWFRWLILWLIIYNIGNVMVITH